MFERNNGVVSECKNYHTDDMRNNNGKKKIVFHLGGEIHRKRGKNKNTYRCYRIVPVQASLPK